MDLITRTFTKSRGNYLQKFTFQTYDIIFAKPPADKEKTNFQKLLKWMRWAFVTGLPLDIEDYETCSAARTPQPKEIVPLLGDENELAPLMAGCNYRGYSSYQHEMALAHLLKNDGKALATEMPIWIKKEQSPNKQPWGGSVDLIRVKDQTIQICDFKPDANKVNQKQVGAQLYRYVYMLHRQTGIPLADIDGIYFDEKNAYKIII